MSNDIKISRELAERFAHGRFDWSHVAELRALLAAPVVERKEPVVIDLDAVDWETIQQAADESTWMPNEYMRNEWVADVCNFLKYGRAEQPAPIAVVSLRDFANAMIDIALEGADADGGHIQELAIKHGLLKPEQRTERCGDTCSCAEYADFPVECFRKVKELNQ